MRRFRLNIPSSAAHVLIKVCKDKSDFDKHIKAFGIECKNAYGICIGLVSEDYSKKQLRKSDACMVYLIEDQVGAGYVTHELTHAVMYLARREIRKLVLSGNFWKDSKASPIEERICDIMGWLHRGFWVHWNKHHKEKQNE